MITKTMFLIGLASLSLVACGAESGADELESESAPGIVALTTKPVPGTLRPVYVGYVAAINPSATTVDVKSLPPSTVGVLLLKYQCNDGSTVEVAGFCEDASWAQAVALCKDAPSGHAPSSPTGIVICSMKD